MRKNLFIALVERLQLIQKHSNGNYFIAQQPDAANAAIQHFDLWDLNLDYLDEEQPFGVPACFIEFLPISWRLQGQRLRDATITFKLHIITRRNAPTRNTSAYWQHSISYLDLLDAINLCLHGYKQQNIGAITATSSEMTTGNDDLMHSIETFSTFVVDTSAVQTLQQVPVSAVLEPL